VSVKENIELVRRGFDAFVAGNMEWLNEHFHENIVWHVPGHNVLSGAHQGREQVLAMFIKSVQLALPEFEIHDVLGSEDHIVVLATFHWRRQDNGETFDDHNVSVFHVENEKALEVWNIQEDPGGFDAFIASAS
jgi:ketosteroid isomerase-like protein